MFYIEVDPTTFDSVKAISVGEIPEDSTEFYNTFEGHKFSITFSASVDDSIINTLKSDVTFIKSSSDEVLEVLYDSTLKQLYIRQYDTEFDYNESQTTIEGTNEQYTEDNDEL